MRKRFEVLKYGDYWMLVDWTARKAHVFLEWSDAIEALDGQHPMTIATHYIEKIGSMNYLSNFPQV